MEALFTIGEIYRDDLNDNAQAQATFEDYLKRYPHSSLAPKATQALAEIGAAEAGGNPFKKKTAKTKNQQPSMKPKAAWAADPRPPQSAPEKTAQTKNAQDKVSRTANENNASDAKALAATAGDDAAVAPQAQSVAAKLDVQPHRLPRLTNIRHWSTPDYTRVAIDLDQEVQYQVGRVPHPDRIFFDLSGAKLASDLVGKSFEVEAGFLHRIRVAQYKPNIARVVLDVDDVAEYSAFLLPNPYRLIIDIHGKLPAQQIASKPELKPAPARDLQPASDVTVTQIKPVTPAKSTESAATVPQPAEKPKSGQLKAKSEETKSPGSLEKVALEKSSLEKASLEKDPLKDSPGNNSLETSKDKTSLEKTSEVAKAVPPKVVVDDSAMDDPSKMTSKPTTSPTFQSIAPQESSRNKKRTPEKEAAHAPSTPVRAAAPTASGERSLIRALGLKIGKIVVDAGHGGHDTGTIGPNGLMEKDLVLDVALKLGKMLEGRLGAEVVYTRDDDTFVPLETRTAIANKEQADMFISIHANSSSDSSARGVETYYLNFTSSRDALEVAARENAVSEKSIHELQDLVKKIALKEKIEESREFAADVQKSLYAGLNAKSAGVRNRGVKKAPFVVLIGANMPSVLAEVSFVSNPGDEKKMKTSDYRRRIADSLYRGINQYISGLSGVKVASRIEGNAGSRGPSAVAAK